MDPAKKKKKYLQKYKESWEKDPLFSKWLCYSSKGSLHAYCKVCKKHLSLKAGKTDLLKHGKGKKHIKHCVMQQLFNDISSDEIQADLNGTKIQKINVHVSNDISSDEIHEEQLQKADLNGTKIQKINTHESNGITSDEIHVEQLQKVDLNGTKIQKIKAHESMIIIEVGNKKGLVQPEESTSEDIDQLLDNVTRTVRDDLENLIKKNKNILKFILRKPGLHEKEISLSWITKVLIGHLSQHYLLECTQEMSEMNETSISMKLNAVEKLIEKSATEMRNLKAQLGNSN